MKQNTESAQNWHSRMKFSNEIQKVGNGISVRIRDVSLCVTEVGHRTAAKIGHKIRAQIGATQQCFKDIRQKLSAEIEGSSHHVTKVEHRLSAEIRVLTQESNQFVKEVEHRVIWKVGETTDCMQEVGNRISTELVEVGDSLRTEVVESTHSLSLQVQNVDRFLLEDRQASIPRFVYVMGVGHGTKKWHINLTHAVAKHLVLQFLCEASYDNGTFHEVSTQKGIDVHKMKNWAKELSPLLARMLQEIHAAGKIAFPGLDFLLGANTERSRVPERLAEITQEVAEMSELPSDELDSFATEQEGLHTSAGTAISSNSSWNSGSEKQLIGDGVKALSRVRKRMEKEGTWNRKVGLKRVRLERIDRGGRKDLVWICSRSHECYKCHRPDSICDAE